VDANSGVSWPKMGITRPCLHASQQSRKSLLQLGLLRCSRVYIALTADGPDHGLGGAARFSR
jgi:hypothetical protein